MSTTLHLLIEVMLMLTCHFQDDTIDVLPVAFLYVFFGPGGAPVINLANVSCYLKMVLWGEFNELSDVQPYRQRHLPWNQLSKLCLSRF